MSRVAFFHWNAKEAEQRAEPLRRAGHQVEVHWEQGGEGVRSVRDDPPQAVVIDLSRLPSHGSHAATTLRQYQATRHVPIIFVPGDPAKTAHVRKLLPDAEYVPWGRIREALSAAIAKQPPPPPRQHAAPVATAGYSKTPLPKKLTIKNDTTVALLGAPAGFDKTLGELPEGVRVKKQARGAADVVILFSKNKADLDRRFAAAKKTMGEGKLWIAWPKKASGVTTDLDGGIVRSTGLGSGLVDFKVCAIDATWSGLLFSRRRAKS